MDAKTLYDRIAGLDHGTLASIVRRLLAISFIEDDGEINPDKDLGSDELGQIADMSHEILDNIEAQYNNERWYTGVAIRSGKTEEVFGPGSLS
jgi:hypothetical protein